MTDVVAVLDTSPLISFHQIGRLELLQSLFDVIVAPPAVAREIRPSLGLLPSWVSERHPVSIPELALALDPGEREAIALAVQHSADVVVLDDLAARRKAKQLGLDVTGSAGLLVLAHRRGLIDAVRPDLDAMMANGLFIGRELYRDILGTTGEAET